MNKIEIKNIGIKNMVLLLIAGILLLICAVPGFFGANDKDDGISFYQQGEGVETETAPTPALAVEERLEALLSSIDGVGKTEVMFLNAPDMEGVVIVAEGAKNPEVMQYISDAVEALFGIPKHKIIVLPMRRESGSN